MPFFRWKCHFFTKKCHFFTKKCHFFTDQKVPLLFHQKVPFFTKKSHFFTENAIFSPKSAIFALKMPLFHQKVPFLHWKCHFFTENAIFSPKKCRFFTKNGDFCTKIAPPQKPAVQGLRPWCAPRLSPLVRRKNHNPTCTSHQKKQTHSRARPQPKHHGARNVTERHPYQAKTRTKITL